MSTTLKNVQFIGSPLSVNNSPKLTSELPGIGKVTSENLEKNANIKYIHELIGVYLVNNMDISVLENYLIMNGKMSNHHVKTAINAIVEYTANHLGLSAKK
jgi:hypothetical protein